jgi:hypothetical protein
MRKLTIWIFMVAAILCAAEAGRGQQASRKQAEAIVQSAMQAMGGEARLRRLTAIEIKGMDHRFAVEQSERPEGPWIVSYAQVDETRDFSHMRLKRETQTRGLDGTQFWESAEWGPVQTAVFTTDGSARVNNGRYVFAGANAQQKAMDSLTLGPESVLLTAAAAGDLHTEPDVTLRGYTHHVVAFSRQGRAVRIFFSAYTNLPAAVEITRPRPNDVFSGPWGDVTTRIEFSLWLLEPNGLRLPHQWTFETNGLSDHTFTVNEIKFEPAVAEEAFNIPDDVKTALAAAKSIDDFPLGGPAVEIAPGVVQVPGSWNVAEIRQSDGIVIIEGPISNGYSAKVIEDAQKRFPNLPIKAVITTSDAWPHIGGLREYAARGIPIYALDLNKPILERLMNSPHRMAADALARSGRQAKFIFVSKGIFLGAGSNRLEIIPLRTTTGERGMAVYFPESKLLYGSDLFQRSGGEFFLPQFLTEIADVVERVKLDVKTVFCMHLEPTPWSEILAAVAKYTAGKQ